MTDKPTPRYRFASPLIIGTMRLGEWGVKMTTKELAHFLDGCLDLGIVDIDHADIYGHYTTEDDFGRVLATRPDLRNKFRITTKCGIKLVCSQRPEHKVKSYDSSFTHILRSVEQSLAALQVDHIDMLLLHRPDYLLNPEEVAAAFTSLKESGKVLHFGVSNYSAAQFELLDAIFPLENHQLEISLMERKAFDDGTLVQCQAKGVAITAWSPVGGGDIFQPAATEHYPTLLAETQRQCEKYALGLDQLLIAWLNKHPAKIVPVLGTAKLERIAPLLAALDITLSHEDWYALWQAASGKDVA